MADSLAGRLLVASPRLVDPNFNRAVICLCAHDEDGALGVILNRPMVGVDVGAALPEWRDVLGPEPVAYAGGPVEPSSALALGLLRGAAAARWRPVNHRVGLIDLGSGPAGLGDGELEAMRVFLGYAGWGAGQLESEIAEDAWFVLNVEDTDPFSPEPENLWNHVLRRQGGRLAMFAFFPPTPNAN